MKLILITLASLTLTIMANSAQTRPVGNAAPPTTSAYSPRRSGQVKNRASDECRVLAGTNNVRAKRGRGPLRGSFKLDTAACNTCQLMKDNNDLAHDLFDRRKGKVTSPGERATAGGYKWRGTAENILYNKGYGGADPTRAVKQWEDSPGHLKNMVGNYEHQGSCHCTDTDGRVYYAQEFGRGDSVGDYTCGTQTAAPAPPPRSSGNLPTSTQRKTYAAPAPPPQSTGNLPTSTEKKTYASPPSTGNLPTSAEKPAGNRPCVASSYGNKSQGNGADELKKRALAKKSKRSAVAGIAYSVAAK